MAELKPAYLISGDDDAKIDAWRARLRKRAEEERGPGGLEIFDARTCEAEEVAVALSTLSFDQGTRYVLVDDVGAWKAPALEPLCAALGALPPETVLVLIVRGKALKQLTKAVESAGGEVRSYEAPKPWELPRWVAERARELGLQLDNEASKTLVTVVGGSQQRLSRELEKLCLALHPARTASAEEVERLAAGEAPPQVYDFADAIVVGDLSQSLRLADELDTHGERPARLIFPVVRRLREVQRAAALLDSGLPEQKVAAALKSPPWVVKKTVAKAKKADRAALERAVCVFADLELELRGGGDAALDEDTAFSFALARAAG
ncbi:MAG TPA: DNA polymerase III subunit delta [Thermoleophilaceae bacterium]|nr:DNA polymerase III subunit delta [Thermoleophilaceae bacterium]